MRDLNLDVLALIASEPSHPTSSDLALVLPETLPLDQNPAAVYLAMLKKNSRRPQQHALDVIAKFLSGGELNCFEIDWSKVRYQHTALVRSHFMDKYAPATGNRMLCALRGTLEQAWLLGQMSAEDCMRASHVKAIIGETLPAGRALSQDEIAALFRDCVNDPRPIGVRDAAVIAILYSGGLRRAELTTLALSEYDAEERMLRVQGKRSKERSVYLADEAVAALQPWLKIRGDEDGPIFVMVNKGDNLVMDRPLTTNGVYYLLKRRAESAGVKTFTPHDFRRTFVGDLLDAGVDIAIVAKMAGHASVDTTARYDRRAERAKQEAAQVLKIPYGV